LVVEDEARVASAVKRGLEAEGFAVDVAGDGTDGLWLAQENSYDAIVLDIMLPGVNGYRVCAKLREAGDWTPILMLTAKNGEYDEAEALDEGADVCARCSGGPAARSICATRPAICTSIPRPIGPGGAARRSSSPHASSRCWNTC
jgi:CheY-like chemotaxis protein